VAIVKKFDGSAADVESIQRINKINDEINKINDETLQQMVNLLIGSGELFLKYRFCTVGEILFLMRKFYPTCRTYSELQMLEGL
jgi:hypothetical protein